MGIQGPKTKADGPVSDMPHPLFPTLITEASVAPTVSLTAEMSLLGVRISYSVVDVKRQNCLVHCVLSEIKPGVPSSFQVVGNRPVNTQEGMRKEGKCCGKEKEGELGSLHLTT